MGPQWAQGKGKLSAFQKHTGARAPGQHPANSHKAGGTAGLAPAHLLALVSREEHVGGQRALGRVGVLRGEQRRRRKLLVRLWWGASAEGDSAAGSCRSCCLAQGPASGASGEGSSRATGHEGPASLKGLKAGRRRPARAAARRRARHMAVQGRGAVGAVRRSAVRVEPAAGRAQEGREADGREQAAPSQRAGGLRKAWRRPPSRGSRM